MSMYIYLYVCVYMIIHAHICVGVHVEERFVSAPPELELQVLAGCLPSPRSAGSKSSLYDSSASALTTGSFLLSPGETLALTGP